MAGYNEIRGLRVKYLSDDPANAENGQVWYNSTTGNLRVQGIEGAGAWSSGGNLNVGRGATGGIGTQTAGLCCSGQISPGPSNNTNSTEEYNGSSWTATGNVGTSRYTMGAAGTQTAGLISMGYSGSA